MTAILFGVGSAIERERLNFIEITPVFFFILEKKTGFFIKFKNLFIHLERIYTLLLKIFIKTFNERKLHNQ